MRQQRSPERARPVSVVAARLVRGGQGRPGGWRPMDPGAGQFNWRAGYLLCIGAAIGYSGAAWLEVVGWT